MQKLRTLAGLAFVSLLTTLGACASEATPSTKDSDIVDPANSNIVSPDLGRITQLNLLPNTNVPRAVLVQLSSERFVADLYDHILTINEQEHLSGAGGYTQAINLIVASRPSEYASLLNTIRARRGLAASAPLPLINPIDRVSYDDVWMQDFGEFAVVRGENDPTHAWYGLLDGNRGRGIDVTALGNILGISVTKVPTPQSAGTYGGNTEATVEGTLYIGDKVPAAYLDGLKRLGNANAIVLPSDWLLVGHVDEYLTVVPARNRCNSAFMVASPLEALNMARKSPDELRSVGDVLGSTNIGPDLDAYAVHRRGPSESYVLSDFDVTRSPANAAQRFIQANLKAEGYAEEAIRRLSATACTEAIPVPQFFKEQRGKAIALNPGTVNSLILRDHAIVPDPMNDALRSVVRQRFGQALGSEANVHYIDDTLYHQADGEVHCGTNVIREIEMPYRF